MGIGLDKELEYHKIEKEIGLYKKKLNNTDYIARKLTESVVKYILSDNGDKTEILALYNEYNEIIDNAQAWRDKINELEEQLKAVQNGTDG